MADDGFSDVADVTDEGYDFAPDPSSVGMDSSDEGENIGDFSTLSRASYDAMRGATATNPYPESFFSRMFGAENVNYTNILGGGQAGLNRVAEINDLRFRQAIGLPSLKTGKQYQAGDYYIGQDTNMGTVKPIPDMARDMMSLMPGGGIMSNFIPQKGLPENDPRYRAIMEEREKSANDPTVFDRTSDFVKSILGFDPKDSGASLAASPVGEGQMRVPDTRTFDAFGNVTGSDLDTEDRFKTIEQLAEERKKQNAINAVTDMLQAKPKYEQRADASDYIPQSFIDAGKGLGQLFDKDGVPIGPGNLRFNYDIEKQEPQFKYSIPFTV